MEVSLVDHNQLLSFSLFPFELHIFASSLLFLVPKPLPLSANSKESSDIFKGGHKPRIKLDVKFDLPKYCGELNAEKLDDWIQQVEVYCRVQNLLDDVDRIQLATLRLGGTTLTWWESKTKAEV